MLKIESYIPAIYKFKLQRHTHTGPFQNKGDREGTCSRNCFAKSDRAFYDFWPYGPTGVCKMLTFEQN